MPAVPDPVFGQGAKATGDLAAAVVVRVVSQRFTSARFIWGDEVIADLQWQRHRDHKCLPIPTSSRILVTSCLPSRRIVTFRLDKRYPPTRTKSQ